MKVERMDPDQAERFANMNRDAQPEPQCEARHLLARRCVLEPGHDGPHISYSGSGRHEWSGPPAQVSDPERAKRPQPKGAASVTETPKQ